MVERNQESSLEPSNGERRISVSSDFRPAPGSQEIGRQFGQSLTAARERCRRSQDEVAEQTGLSAESIALIERGEARPTLETMVKLAEAVSEDP